MKERSIVISTPEEAGKVKTDLEGEFSTRTALRLFERIAKATRKSKGREVEFQMSGRKTSLSELISDRDIKYMKIALKSKGWNLTLDFYEGEEDPGHYAPGWQNIVEVGLSPIKPKKKTS